MKIPNQMNTMRKTPDTNSDDTPGVFAGFDFHRQPASAPATLLHENALNLTIDFYSASRPYSEIERLDAPRNKNARDAWNGYHSPAHASNSVINCCVHSVCKHVMTDLVREASILSNTRELFSNKRDMAVTKRRAAIANVIALTPRAEDKKVVMTEFDLDHAHCFYPIID
jgi:hypothetical protein